VIDPFLSGVRAEDLGINIVETTLNVENEQGDFAAQGLEGTHCVHEGSTGIKRGEEGERPALVGVQEASISSDWGKAEGNDPF